MYRKNKPAYSYSSGFSLLELLIYVAILAIVIVAFSTAFISFNNTRAMSEAEREVNRALRFVGEKITRDLQHGGVLISPSDASATSTLHVVGEVTSIYMLEGGRITRQIGTSTIEALSDARVRITELSFTRFENYNEVLQATSTSISWHIVAEYAHAAPEYGYTGTKQGTVLLRN